MDITKERMQQLAAVGEVALAADDTVTAMRSFMCALTIARALEDPAAEITQLVNIARSNYMGDRTFSAEQGAKQCLKLAQTHRLTTIPILGYAYNILGALRVQANKPDRAWHYFELALRVLTEWNTESPFRELYKSVSDNLVRCRNTQS